MKDNMFQPSCGHQQVSQVENTKSHEAYAPIWDPIGVTFTCTKI
jgi:hypothetical protein